MSAIIHSLLDTDLYKFTMLQVVLHKFPQTHSVYHFRCRNLQDTVYPLTDILDDLNEQLDYLCQLKFKEDELLYLPVEERRGSVLEAFECAMQGFECSLADVPVGIFKQGNI